MGALLKLAYANLDSHFDRLKATCYISLPPQYEPRENLAEAMRALAKAASANPPDHAANGTESRKIAASLAALRHYGDPGTADWRTPKAPESGPDGLEVETAAILVELAERMPAQWAEPER